VGGVLTKFSKTYNVYVVNNLYKRYTTVKQLQQFLSEKSGFVINI